MSTPILFPKSRTMYSKFDSKTRKIYAASITDEKSGDAPEFKKLLSEALHNIENSVNVVVPADQLLVSVDGAMILMTILNNVKKYNSHKKEFFYKNQR